jgi:hypothetical protein
MDVFDRKNELKISRFQIEHYLKLDDAMIESKSCKNRDKFITFIVRVIASVIYYSFLKV